MTYIWKFNPNSPESRAYSLYKLVDGDVQMVKKKDWPRLVTQPRTFDFRTVNNYKHNYNQAVKRNTVNELFPDTETALKELYEIEYKHLADEVIEATPQLSSPDLTSSNDLTQSDSGGKGKGKAVNRSIDKDEVLKITESKLEKFFNNEDCNYLYGHLDPEVIRFLAIIIYAFFWPLWIFKHFNINESNIFEILDWLPCISLSIVVLGIIFSLISGTFQKQIKQRDYLSLSLYPLYLINSISCIYFGYGWLLISLAIFLLSIFIAKKTKSYKQWGNFRIAGFIYKALLMIIRILKQF